MKSKSTLRSFFTLAASTLLAVSYTHAAVLTWDPDGDAAAVNPANDVWSTAAGNLFWNNGGGVANVPWATGNEAVFGGAASTYTITVGGAVTVQRLTFSSSGYTLSAVAPEKVITMTPASGSPLLQVDSGVTATIGASVAISFSNSMNVGQSTGSTAAGTLNIDGTGAILRTGNNVPGISFSGAGLIVNLKNGTIRNQGSSTASGNISVGSAAGSDVTMNVSGGVLTAAGTAGLIVGGTGKGTVTQTGALPGTSTITIGSASTLGLTLGNAAANVSSNTFHLDGGTLNTPTVKKGAGTDANAAVFNFNGGLLVANNAAANATFMQGLSAANVKAGGAKIQNAQSITINQALLNDAGSPGGGLTKTGAGTLTLGGNNTYTGATTVTTGTLLFATGDSGTSSASDVSVATGAAGGVIVATPGFQHVNSGDLSLSDTSTLVVNYGINEPNASTAPLSVDNFTLGNGITLQMGGTVFPGTPYPLVSWTTNGPVNGNAFNPVVVNGLVGALSVSNNTLFVQFTAPTPISWNTGNGTWDTSTSNWVDQALVATTFTNTEDAVLFGDAAGVTGNPVVTLNSTFTPLGVTMSSASREYTISGSGTIAGPAGLTLGSSNLGKLTLATANTYTGNTQVLGGTLRLGDGGATGSLAAASPISSAFGTTFEVNQSDTVTQGTDFGVISGDGGFAQTGAGTTVLNSVNTFTGPTSVTSGSLQIGATGRLDGGTYAGEIAVALGSSFQYGGTATQTLSGIISGQGSLAKSNTGLLILGGENTYSGSTSVSGGTLRLADLAAIASSSSISMSGGILQPAIIDTNRNFVINAPIALDTGTTSQINAPFTAGIGGAVETLTLNQPITGDGSIRLFGSSEFNNTSGTILLNAQNTYTGNTELDTAGTAVHLAGVNLFVKSGTNNSLPVTTVLTIDGDLGRGTGRTVQFDLNGFNQTLAGLTNVTTGTGLRIQRVTNTGAFATLTINNSANFNFGSTSNAVTSTQPSAKITGNVNLTKSGAATFTLVGIHHYAGNTTVNEGILSLSADNLFNDASNVTIDPDARLDLNFGGTDTVNKLFIGATPQANGVYGALESGAQFEIAQITGTATLTVVPGGYTAWAGTNAGGQGADLDFDNDGVSNGVEFFMNSPAGFTANPQLDASNTITWLNGGNIPSVTYGSQFVVQTSSDLSFWTNVPLSDPNLVNATGSVTYTLTGESPRFVRLRVIPN